ncbi:MAG: hypothetical protein ACHQ53_11235 [Polyangiales bacterium]
MRAMVAALFCFSLCAVGGGCSKKEVLPPPAPGGGSGSIGTTGAGHPPDAAVKPSGDEDAGHAVAAPALANECVNVPATPAGADLPTSDFVNAIGMPTDFAVTRVVASWEASCARPTLRIAMSDGACPSGHGHELSFSLDALALDAGTIHGGLNTVVGDPTPDQIAIRYVRPNHLDPTGTWGTCNDASGTLDLLGDLATTAGTVFQGRFDLLLTACDGSTNLPQSVSGTFNVSLRRGVKDVCP